VGENGVKQEEKLKKAVADEVLKSNSVNGL
jgi:hypothetical protein